MKKLWTLALFLCLCLTLGLRFPARAADTAVYAVTGGTLTFDPATGTVTDCGEAVTAAEIPARIGGVDVAAIGKDAFFACEKLTSVTIPNTVKTIGDQAFWSCKALESVVIPEGVESIGEHAFYSCEALKTVSIPGSVKTIGNGAFSTCFSVESITLADGVESIGARAFGDCDLCRAVSIPKSVTAMEGNPFSGCDALEKFTVSPENAAYTARGGVLYSKDMTRLVAYPIQKKDASFDIPEGVKTIGDNAFTYAIHLVRVSIPESVESIGSYALQGCYQLQSVSIPKNTAHIGDGAFAGGYVLAEILVDSENAAYVSRDGVLYTRDMKRLLACPAGWPGDSFAIPEGVESVGGGAFQSCGLKSLTVPKSVRSFGNLAFSYCHQLKDVYYAGSEAEWNAVEVGVWNDPIDLSESSHAVFHFNSGGEKKVSTPDLDSVRQAGNTVELAFTGGPLASGQGQEAAPAKVFAFQDGAAALSGTYEGGRVTFSKPPETGRKLFFLDPDTLVPLAEPVELK